MTSKRDAASKVRPAVPSGLPGSPSGIEDLWWADAGDGMLTKTTVTRPGAGCLLTLAALLLSGLVPADAAAVRSLPVAADVALPGRSIQGVPAGTQSLVTLPAGRLGRSYHRRLLGMGGTPPYRFALESGSLPAGLTLSEDGLLSGTPTGGGDWSFTALVVDSSGQSKPQFYHLRIVGSEPPRR